VSIRSKELSVSQAAALCGVGRTTVGYWIRSQKLRANRIGRNYSIPVQDLLFFLKSTGQKIPYELQGDNLKGPIFKSFQHCWEYWQPEGYRKQCENCIASKNQIEACFTARNSKFCNCSKICDQCQYYLTIFLPRIHFVHQMNMPAAVIKDFYFWCGNAKWERLCEFQNKDLIGMGIEKIIHPSSLELVISGIKRKVLEVSATSESCRISIKNKQSEKIEIGVAVYPLNEPEGAFLVIADV
jgi:excisionase family DNA binding protein